MTDHNGDFKKTVRITECRMNIYEGHDGGERRELYLTCTVTPPFKEKISCHAEYCFLRAENECVKLRVPVYSGELKHFYDNHEDYYYLPLEDYAVHRSVAEFVDRTRRKKATPATCYTRREGLFIPEWDNVLSPVFKRNYKDNLWWAEYTEDLQKNSAALEDYAAHVMEHVLLFR